MPRLSLKFLLKAFVAMMLCLFLLPLLLNKLDSPADPPRTKRIKKELERQFKPMDGGGGGGVLHMDQQQQEQPQQDVAAGGAPQQLPLPGGDQAADPGQEAEPVKTYGPKAVLKSGVLGNFEPTIATKYGPGENGEPVYTGMNEKQASDRSTREFGFNMVASDKIAMDRTIPDTRLDECKYWHYPEDLPKASVIIVFHNEGWSTLMRTVHSVINMSPPQFLEEVVMVDDFSDKEHLKGKLDEYIKQFNGKVKLYRNSERLGLIGTRTKGARYATGEVIVFLDAHCECNRNWLPPLLARIRYDRTIMTVPIIDGIKWDTFRYSPVYSAGENYRGIFEWGFLYKESRVPDKELNKRQHKSEPYWSPTHAGGLFAMDRSYFFELGAYDDGLQIWGGENFELSFKIWQCGGSIEWVPCSRVGHVYRMSMPYGFGKISTKIPVISLNYMRVVEVWLDDEFKEYFYTREPTIKGYPIGDIEKQLKFKKDHKCKSFDWFMDNIAYEVYDKFPKPPPNKAWGEIKTRTGTTCWDTYGHGPGGDVRSSHCHHVGGSQLFRLNTEGRMEVGERCLDAGANDGVTVKVCPVTTDGPWNWDKSTGLIRHTKKNKCVEAGNNSLRLTTCNESSSNQLFEVNNVRTW